MAHRATEAGGLGLGVARWVCEGMLDRARQSVAGVAVMLNARGTSTVEFSLVAMLVLLPLLTAVLELAQLAVARQALGYAATEVARVLETVELGSESNDLRSHELRARRVAGIALLPLFSQGDAVAGEASAPAAVVTRSVEQTLRPDLLQIGLEALSPATPESARFVGVHRVTLRYCRELYFAPISELLPALLRPTAFEPFDQLCLARSRLPISASAVVIQPRVLAPAQP
ncbi:MAG: pilus assembly protein [Sinobacteraceae bacterium]|nr:pilus assembly protein [Nevskiaceae bacterium]